MIGRSGVEDLLPFNFGTFGNRVLDARFARRAGSYSDFGNFSLLPIA